MRNAFRKVNLKKTPPLPLNPKPSLNILQLKKNQNNLIHIPS